MQKHIENRPRLARTSLIFLGLASFVLISQIIRLTLPNTLPVALRNKLDLIHDRKEPIHLFFIGSSVTHKGISPAAFDRQLQTRGLQLQSFNLGDNQMVPPESYALAERLPADKPPGWTYLVMELFRMEDAWRGNTKTRRYVWWHDTAETGHMLQSIWAAPQATGEKLRLSKLHLEAWLIQLFGVGQTVDLMRLSSKADEIFVGPQRDGYVPYSFSIEAEARRGVQRNPEAERRTRFLDHLDKYNTTIAKLAQKPRSEPPANPAHLKRLKQFDRRMRDRGITVLYVIHPLSFRADREAALAREASLEHVVNLNDPERFPELYAPSSRWDNDHLSDRGAILFSQILADRFAEILASTSREEP